MPENRENNNKNNKNNEKPKPHPHELPPHIIKELFAMKEKIGKLEGMLEVILKKM